MGTCHNRLLAILGDIVANRLSLPFDCPDTSTSLMPLTVGAPAPQVDHLYVQAPDVSPAIFSRSVSVVIAQYRVDDKRAVVADIVAATESVAAATAKCDQACMVERGHACIEAAQPQRCPCPPVRGSGAKRPLRSWIKSTTVDNGGTGSC